MTFSNSGPASFSVPAGVQVIQAIASGGAGGAGTPTSGGLGCEVTGSISVNAGDTLSLFVGQNGTAGTGGAPGTGGLGGNGDSGSWSGAGGAGSGSTNAGAGGGGGSATALFDGTTSTIIAAVAQAVLLTPHTEETHCTAVAGESERPLSRQVERAGAVQLMQETHTRKEVQVAMVVAAAAAVLLAAGVAS